MSAAASVTTRCRLIGFDPLGMVTNWDFDGVQIPVFGSARTARQHLTESDRRVCVLSISDGTVDNAAVRLRTELTQAALRTQSLLVPCTITDPAQGYAGPWLWPWSTPCSRCFSPDLLPIAPAFKQDEEVGGEKDALSPLQDALSPPDAGGQAALADAVLRDAVRILQRGLPGVRERSVWGRILAYRATTSGLARSSWRALKDPECPLCGRTDANGSASGRRLSQVLHENTKLRSHFREGDAIDRSYADKTLIENNDAVSDPGQKIALPPAQLIRSVSIEEAISKRRSRRNLGSGALSLDDLAALFHYSAGITGWANMTSGAKIPLRAAPSGGALYPIDLYAFVRRVTGIPSGLYRYHPAEHSLIDTGIPVSQCGQLSAHSAHAAVLDSAAAIFILAATFERCQNKYLDRGYRLILMESGHIAQNFQLIATARQLRVCGITGFVDDTVNAVLGFPPTGGTQALYLLAVGTQAANS